MQQVECQSTVDQLKSQVAQLQSTLKQVEKTANTISHVASDTAVWAYSEDIKHKISAALKR